MRNQTSLPAATFKALFHQLIHPSTVCALARRCGVRRRCPPLLSLCELVGGLRFRVLARAGTLACHVKVLTGQVLTDGQRHFLVRVKRGLKRRLLERYADGSALVEIGPGATKRLAREVVGRGESSANVFSCDLSRNREDK
jgi:hypothetical protein